MVADDRILAWTRPLDGGFQAAFVSEQTVTRRGPATQWRSSLEAARLWVEQQAGALGMSVTWVLEQDAGLSPAEVAAGDVAGGDVAAGDVAAGFGTAQGDAAGWANGRVGPDSGRTGGTA